MNYFYRVVFAPIIVLFLVTLANAQVIGQNAGFENGKDSNADGWQYFDKGYTRDTTTVHSGKFSIRCANNTDREVRGGLLSLDLNQTTATPIHVTGWSRADNVSGLPNSDYSLYVDLDYVDGTNQWGIVEPFDTQTHDWQKRTLLVVPSRPIKTLKVYVLFRNHSGTVWFDDVTVSSLPATQTFDSQLLTPPLLPMGQVEGWFVRDVAANSAILPPEQLGCRLTITKTPPTVRARVEDLQGKDRAITVYYVRRFQTADPIWWNDLDDQHPVGNQEWANITPVHVGATGGLSLYPFACVTGRDSGEAVGIPPRLGPRIYRIGYHGASQLFFVAFDISLTDQTSLSKRTADVAIVNWKVDSTWGFRDATAGYYGLFPVAFARRAKADGIWMPFTDPATVKNVTDFGFAYHEGDNCVVSDDGLGILSFRYTEPHSYWMVMPPEVPRTYENAFAQLQREAAGKQGNATQQRGARAVLQSGTKDASGKFQGHFENAPWANGIAWRLNANPQIVGADTKAKINYTPEDADKRYTPGIHGALDGEYLDSVEAWSDTLDYRPENLKASTVPLTFTKDELRPVLPLWFSLYEFIRWEADDLHHRGRLLFGNSLPIQLSALTSYFDVMGIETNWIVGDDWRPDSEETFRLRRTLSGTKPYLLLMNTNFDKMTPERVEGYFQRCMAWAVFPSMFSVNAADSPYWENPKWYNRDRPLFKKYIPVIKQLSAAGWQPIPLARATNLGVRIERFGNRLFTVRNVTNSRVSTKIRLNRNRLGWGKQRVRVSNMVNHETLTSSPNLNPTEFFVELPANGVLALEMKLQ